MQTPRCCMLRNLAGVLGILLLMAPTRGRAQEESCWERERRELQETLIPGRDRDFYSAKITDLGYRITFASVDPYYEEYEVVKDGLNYAVKINVAQTTDDAAQVKVARDTSLSETTERILAHHVQATRITRPTGAIGKDREEADSRRARLMDDSPATARLIQELETLPIGMKKAFYRDELKYRGHEIAQVNLNNPKALDFEVEKNGHRFALMINLNADTAVSREINACPLR